MSNMTDDSRYRAAKLAVMLAKEYPAIPTETIARIVYDMQQAARAAKAWELKRCNVPMTEAQLKHGEAGLAQRQHDLNRALASLLSDPRAAQACVVLGGDARGPCAKLTIPGYPGDSWEAPGYAIY